MESFLFLKFSHGKIICLVQFKLIFSALLRTCSFYILPEWLKEEITFPFFFFISATLIKILFCHWTMHRSCSVNLFARRNHPKNSARHYGQDIRLSNIPALGTIWVRNPGQVTPLYCYLGKKPGTSHPHSKCFQAWARHPVILLISISWCR